MAERESMDSSSGLRDTNVSGEECGNTAPLETFDSYLKLAKECMETVQKIPSRKFNNEQCEYLAQKLEVVVHSASSFLEVSRAKCHAPCSSMDMTRGVEIFRLLLSLAKQIESFVHGCCEDAWIQSAMTLTNVSEYVSSVGFNLELCRVAFCTDCAATGLTLDEVDDISRGVAEIVEKKASVDVDTLFDKVILTMPSLSNENKDLAIYLLQRLKRVKSIPASVLSGYSLVTANDGGFFGKLFRRVQQTVRLGTCGSGATVDKAMWLGTEVAVKTFYEPEDPEFVKEVEILGRLYHPNITSMFCSAMDRRRCSIIMELMDEDLHALMHRRLDANIDSPPFHILEAVDIMLQIGEGVNYLQSKRIMHRDLKSMNILVKSMKVGESEIGYVHVKVTDFGLSKIKESSIRFSTLTTNTGTTKWMAPEVIYIATENQERPSKNVKMPKYIRKVDVYSFAMVCYEILTGQVPFSEISSPMMIKMKVLNGDRPKLPNHCPHLLKTLIEECWNQEPIKRPTFGDICKRLKYLKCLLMTSPHLTIEEPLQEKTKSMPMDSEEKPLPLSRIESTTLQVSTKVKPSLTIELAKDTLQDQSLRENTSWNKRKLSLKQFFEPSSEPTSESIHVVYLSHSGAQKRFVENLCEDLERHDIQFPESETEKQLVRLPTYKYHRIILDAMKQCQVGVLIISEDFLISKWPMIELVAMIKEMEKPNSYMKIIPVYYDKSWNKLFDKENRMPLEMEWQRWANADKRINLEEWMKALNMLKPINGIVHDHSLEELSLRQEIVNATLNLTSPQSWQRDEFNVQGGLRLYEVLYKQIYQKDCNGVRIIGLYGTEGIGKTTLCKVMCKVLFQEFLGRVCHAELEKTSEVGRLREVLRRLTNISDKLLSESNIDQYYDRLQKHIHRHRIFLVVDNVSGSSKTIEQAKSYLKAEYAPGSVVLVATCSLGILQSLNIDERNCLEMPKLEEEEARSLFLYHAAPDNEVDEELLQQCMGTVKQFYAGVNDSNSYHYHPIALKQFGVQLGFRPEQWGEKLTKWTSMHRPSVLRKSFDMLIPGSRPSFLRKSFNTLVLEDQLLYMDAALFYPEPPEHGSTFKQLNILKWLSSIHGMCLGDVMWKLEELQSKFLLEHLGDGSTRIGMHPLAREFCESEANVGEPAIRRWIYNDSEILEEHVLPEHAGCWENMCRICLRGSGSRKKLSLKYCTNVTVLKLVRCHFENQALDLSPLTSLKSLEILSCTSSMSESSPIQILGLGLLRNLVVLKWDDIPSGSPCIEELGFLNMLQVLELDSSDNKNKLPNVGTLSLLREATFRFGKGADTLSGFTRKMSSLQILDLGGCHQLISCPGICNMVALQELDLSDCLELEELPDLRNLTNLKKLNISGCRSIRALPSLRALFALQELDLCYCSLLEWLPQLGTLKHLQKLEMRNCFSIEELLGLGDLLSLQELDLQGCAVLKHLPDLGKLSQLRKLDITDCHLIQAVRGLSPSLQEFRAERCSGLIELPDIRKLTNLLVLNINLER